MDNKIPLSYVDLITYPCPKLSSSLANLCSEIKHYEVDINYEQ